MFENTPLSYQKLAIRLVATNNTVAMSYGTRYRTRLYSGARHRLELATGAYPGNHYAFVRHTSNVCVPILEPGCICHRHCWCFSPWSCNRI